MIDEIHLPLHTRFSKWRFNIRWRLLAVVSLFVVLLGGAACASQDSESDLWFSLTSSEGQEVSLENLAQEHDRVVIVFYRGYF